MKISSFSIRRPVFTIVTMLFVLILGVVSFIKIPVTLIPDLNPPIGVVVTNYPGASPIEVNEKVTKPLEAVLSTLPGIKKVQSTSQEGANLIILEFSWSTNMDEIQTDILQRLDLVTMPDGVGRPSFLKFDPAQFPIIQLALQSEKKEEDIQLLAEQLEQELLRIDGVASVTTSGSLVEEIQIILNAQKLQEKGLTQTDIVQVIQANNISLPGELITTDENQVLTTRVVSLLTSAEMIEKLQISVNPLTGQPLYIRDIAEVKQQQQQQATITRVKDHPAVLMSVIQEADANTAQVSENFQQALDELLSKPQYASVRANILTDQGSYVRLAIDNIGSSLLFGAIFAMAVLFFFLRNIKSPLIVGVAIPYSVIVTFVLMYFANFSLNIMTLGALALGIGMLVDNAIVVIENIERHLGMGKSRKVAAIDGTAEVGGAIIASTLTTVAVFIPIIFISGLIGQIFVEFALTISFSLFASLVVALTVIPMLASKFLIPAKQSTHNRKTLNEVYRRALQWAIQHSKYILVAVVILLVLCGWKLYKTGTEFLPATDEGFVTVEVALPKGTAVERTEQVVKEVETILNKQPEIDTVVSLIGSNQQALSRGQVQQNEAELYVKLLPLSERERSVFEFSEEMKKEVEKFITADAEIEFSLATSTGSTPNTLSFRVTDTDEKQLEGTVGKIKSELEKTKDVLAVQTDLDNVVDEIQVEVNQQKAVQYGFLPAQIAQMVQQMTKGMLTTQIVSEEGDVKSVYTGYGERFIQNINELESMQLRTPSGSYIALKEVAEVKIVQGETALRRSDQAAAVAVFVTYKSSQSLSGISQQVDQAIEKLQLPATTMIMFGGDRELFDSAKNDMKLAILLAVILVYLVMAAQFESFKYPFIMILSVPLMIIGVVLALIITNTLLGVTVVIGILVLVGIVVNNGIVLVDFIKQKIAAGVAVREAILLGSEQRLRPILMTALTTILGLIPLALGLGEGTEYNQPMAIVVIGGLVASTFLTLFIVPIIYGFMEKIKK